MTVDQVKLIKEAVLKDNGSGKPIADTLSVLFNNEVTFRNSDDFVIWDDANELVHAIKINMDGPRQSAIAPYRIATGCFGNIQFLEGLFTMSNFSKAIDELFVKTGLITDEKREMIMKWADGIRNNMCVPSNPGPYYPEGPMIPPKPPKPDVRPGDGIFHGAPIDQRTRENKIRKLVDPVLKGNEELIPTRPNSYRANFTKPDSIVATFKAAIQAVPEKDLFWASLSNNKMYAEWHPKVPTTMEKFEEVAKQLLPTVKGATSHLDLYIEAYGVRVRYCFALTLVNDDEADNDWKTATQSQVISAVSDMASIEGVNEALIGGFNINVSISAPSDLGLTDMVASMDNLQVARYKYEGIAYLYTPGGDTTSFMKGVINSMPNDIGETTNSELELQSTNGATLTYTLKVKYFSDADFPVEMGGKKYETLLAAINAAGDGDTVTLVKDIDGITAMIPIKKSMTIDLAGHTINANTDYLFVATGMTVDDMVTIKNGTIINTKASSQHTVLAQKACVTVQDLTINTAGVFGVEAGVGAQGYWGRMWVKNCDITAQVPAGIYGPETQYKEEYTEPVSIMDIDGTTRLTSTGSYGVMANGAAHNANVTIADGCEITTPNWGIYLPQDGESTIGAVKINAGVTGIEMRAGKVTLNNTEISGITATEMEVAPNGNGTTVHGAGVAMSQHTTKIPMTLNLNNVKAEGVYGLYEANPQNNQPMNGVINITGGSYKGSVGSIYAVDLRDFVPAGVTLSHEIGNELLVSGVKCEAAADGNGFTTVEYDIGAETETAVDGIIEGIPETSGIVVVPDESANNVYSITTSTGSISESGLFDQLAAVNGLKTITVTDGTTEVEYTPAGNLDEFKAAVDALVPKANADAEVTLTMTVVVE